FDVQFFAAGMFPNAWCGADERPVPARNGVKAKGYCMSRKTVQRFCQNDMHKDKDLKARVA
ncbi:hypothetical protein EN820_54625, partial [bacterium M00.F.Ca.ET.177.01.1.1]